MSEPLITISPTTNEPILERPSVTAAELERLPGVAHDAFQTFHKTSLASRQEIVRKALKLLVEQKDELAMELTVQMGRPIAYTAKEIATAVKRAEYLLSISDDVLKDTDGEVEGGFQRFIRKVAVGTVLIIFAWNVSLVVLIPIHQNISNPCELGVGVLMLLNSILT
jgi:acyl-CoA reductase-like NAD-dependent aldehyde dehydrogenase